MGVGEEKVDWGDEGPLPLYCKYLSLYLQYHCRQLLDRSVSELHCSIERLESTNETLCQSSYHCTEKRNV